MTHFSRRRFVLSTPLLATAPAWLGDEGSSNVLHDTSTLDPTFPSHPPALAHEIVGASHGNVARVKELVGDRPALARAAWDWGYGDWETALGAASHVGNREIADLLLTNGAQPTIFSAAMLGHLDVVRAFIAARPGIQKIRGPHGLTLLHHARAGGEGAAAVVAYLESLGDADPRYPNDPLSPEDLSNLTGTYTFGDGPNDKFVVTTPPRGGLMMKREGMADRPLWHHGKRVFNPAGAEAVRIRFEPPPGRAAQVAIEDGSLRVIARRG